MSMARGNWFDCTPTRQTTPSAPFWRRITSLSGTMVLVSSQALMTTSTSSPSAFEWMASSVMP